MVYHSLSNQDDWAITLRSYAYDLLHFLRWWVKGKHSTAITEKGLTEAALLDYIRFQVNQQPPPAAASINRRVGIAERALQLAFPQAQTPFVRGFQSGYGRPLPLAAGSLRPALSRLRVWTPKRVIVPLSAAEVEQFWARCVSGCGPRVGDLTAMGQTTADQIYQLKIVLKYRKPPVWRRVLVTGETMIGTLHEIVQIVMGWQNRHL